MVLVRRVGVVEGKGRAKGDAGERCRAGAVPGAAGRAGGGSGGQTFFGAKPGGRLAVWASGGGAAVSGTEGGTRPSSSSWARRLRALSAAAVSPCSATMRC